MRDEDLKVRALDAGADLHLTRTGLALWAELARNPEGVSTHENPLVRVWG